MTACPICSFNNRPGAIICTNCIGLIGGIRKSTTTTAPLKYIAFVTKATRRSLTQIDPYQRLRLRLHHSETEIALPLEEQIVLGHRDPQSRHKPDVNLGPYGALNYGVSRQHAAVCRIEDRVAIADLDSTNGTYVNGRRMKPFIPLVLRDADVIALGNMVATVCFGKRRAVAA